MNMVARRPTGLIRSYGTHDQQLDPDKAELEDLGLEPLFSDRGTGEARGWYQYRDVCDWGELLNGDDPDADESTQAGSGVVVHPSPTRPRI